MRRGGTSYLEAVREALDEELARDERVVLIGEDLLVWGGPYGACRGLAGKYPGRVLNAPISEGAFVGAAVGAACTGLRPVVELMFCDFLGVCLEPLLNSASKLRWITGGQLGVPLTVRTTIGADHSLGATHGQTLYALVAHVPGLKVVAPATPADAKALLRAAIRDPNPVLVFEHKALYYRLREELVDDDDVEPLGVAAVRRAGDDVTVVAVSRALEWALSAATRAASEGISVEVVDPRTLVPLDLETIARSVAKTGRLLVVDEAAPFCSVGSEIVSSVARTCFSSLRRAPELVTPPATPIPFAPSLEAEYLPGPEDIFERVLELVRG